MRIEILLLLFLAHADTVEVSCLGPFDRISGMKTIVINLTGFEPFCNFINVVPSDPPEYMGTRSPVEAPASHLNARDNEREQR